MKPRLTKKASRKPTRVRSRSAARVDSRDRGGRAVADSTIGEHRTRSAELAHWQADRGGGARWRSARGLQPPAVGDALLVARKGIRQRLLRERPPVHAGVLPGLPAPARDSTRSACCFTRSPRRRVEAGESPSGAFVDALPGAAEGRSTRRARLLRTDFVAETAQRIYMLETKASGEVSDPEVVAKKAAAELWCQRASDHAAAHGGKPWSYALTPHDLVKDNISLEGTVDASRLIAVQ